MGSAQHHSVFPDAGLPAPRITDVPVDAGRYNPSSGCGGTSKTADAETVWNNNPDNPDGNGTGGGFSQVFQPMPPWQAGAPHGPGRMVPDVAGNADPDTGYEIVVHGESMAIGGTSAVAPLYAGLFAAFGRKLGFVTPKLWQNQTCFNDTTQGDNGFYRARIGPDPCTGLGSPIASKLAAIFNATTVPTGTLAAAGVDLQTYGAPDQPVVAQREEGEGRRRKRRR